MTSVSSWCIPGWPLLYSPLASIKSASFLSLPPLLTLLLVSHSNEAPPSSLFNTLSPFNLFFFFSSSKFLLFVLAPCERTDLECPGQRRVSEPACWDGEERWTGSKALITSKFSLFSQASTYPPLHPFRSLLCVGPICRPSCCEYMLHFEVPSLGEAKLKRRLNPLRIIQPSCSQRARIIYQPYCIITLERQRYNLLFFCEDENFEFLSYANV